MNLMMKNGLKMYDLAKAYYEHHGNLKVPDSFKTKMVMNMMKMEWLWEVGLALKEQYIKELQVIKKCHVDQVKLLEEIGLIGFEDKLDEKLQQEQITPENLERKKTEIQNRFYSVLNNHNSDSLPSSEELNQEFLEQLNTSKKM